MTLSFWRGALYAAPAAILLAGCSAPAPPPPAAPTAAPAQIAAQASAAPTAGAATQPTSSSSTTQGVLAISPEKGIAGTPFTVTASQLTPGQTVDVQWTTWDGSYSATVAPETLAYNQRTFTEKRVSLGQLTADAQGRATGSYTAPQDYGQLHEVHAVVDGQDVARGGFQVLLDATAFPSDGPIGTPIHIHVTGLDTNLFSGSTLAVRYDNAFTGILTAATTGGTADADIRATGPMGPHTISIGAGTVPAYLNIHQSPYDFLYAHTLDGEGFQFGFNVSSDDGPPETSVEWPASGAVKAPAPGAQITTAEASPNATATASLSPSTGPIQTQATLTASSLTPDTDVTVLWMTARGDRVSGNGWDLQAGNLAQGHADTSGRLSLPLTIPDDLGGWHEIKLVQNDKTMVQTPFYVERSLVSISPTTITEGQTVTIHAKGLGWTELDNGFAVTYDNMFVGYACGFNSNGDVSMPLPATGAPGTHLIDLYPTVYNGHDNKAWYWAPVLTFGTDFPALSYGYNLPAFHLAIDVVQ